MTDKTDIELMQQALDSMLDAMRVSGGISDKMFESVNALSERLAQPDPRNQCGETCERAKLCAVCLAEMGTQPDPLQRLTDVQQEIETALSQPEQKPVAWLSTDSIGERYLWFSKPLDNDKAQPLYTAPQKREWQRLTDEEKLIDLLEAARETFKKSPSGSECSQNAAYVHSVLETMLIKREWQGLTNEEISAISKSIPGETDLGLAKRLFARAIEDKLKEKND